RLGFEPLAPLFAVYALCGFAAVSWLLYVANRGAAAAARGLALTVLALALANPAIVNEEREPLTSVAAVVVDRSESMAFGNRKNAADAALEALRSEFGDLSGIDVRFVESAPDADGTALFAAAESALADVPRDRIAGAILVTDGQVIDQPANADAPFHALVVGDPDRGDRRIEIVKAPSFGIVGETASVEVRVDDPNGGLARIYLSLNGNRLTSLQAPIGQTIKIPVEIERRQDNVLVVETDPGDEELTLANNATAAIISGVRDRLRVLLITGRPNAAGRVWRDLLKSDPQVDLVHFTILRSPDKLNLEPTDELALIPFPREELFEEKLDEFDLIIFDQYERSTVLTDTYFANMASYVDDGGALMIIAGSPFSTVQSLANTALRGVLPATPTGDVTEGPFLPELDEAGRRHTVTSPLQEQTWGSWRRYIDARPETGDVLMTGPEGRPLLIVDRVGDGRVGLLLSDQIWLWARGHEGGGPFSELIRRLVHWLMKEPELEERQLELSLQGDGSRIALRTLSDTPPRLDLEGPEGDIIEPAWTPDGPGRFTAEAPVEGLGLYRARAGGLEAVALKGPANPREYAALESTTEVLEPLLEPFGGRAFRLDEEGEPLPDIRVVGRRGAASGADWLGLRERGAYVVRGSESFPLLPGLLGVILALGFALWAWRREGR
ncbi:MAG: hypothetical protein AAFQ67_02805, partial [Pseudomonadota bacterium]